jgi:hypothetical protein
MRKQAVWGCLAGETPLIIARLIVPVVVAVAVLEAGAAAAQGAFPAPLPGQSAAPAPATPANASPFPGPPSAPPSGAPSPFPATGASPLSGGGGAFSPARPTAGPSDACMKGFIPLREEAEKRGKLIKAASDRKAGPDEACKLIGNFSHAEVKMIKYIEANATKCGIPPQVSDQMKQGHKNTEAMQQKVCGMAQQMAQQKAAAAPSLSDVLGTTTMPEAQTTKKGGSTFDTLNGNVLTR